MKDTLEKLVSGQNLTQSETAGIFDQIMAGATTPAQVGAILAALRAKGETPEEIAGGATAMRNAAVRIDVGELEVVDTCGTGGDGSQTFNISTVAALVTAGADVPVAKHGNRSITSKCGSADVLMELGVNLDASPETIARCIREAGIGFMFAPKMHPAMKHAMGPRKELGIRTIFNMLGPLTNPAGAKRQVIGVFSPDLTEVFANVLQLLGSARVFVVHGEGIDEISTSGITRISELVDGKVRSYEFDPREIIGEFADRTSLAGGDAAENAATSRKILSGEKGSKRDIVCLNAAAAIVAGGKAKGFADGWERAQESIDSGNAQKALDAFVEVSQQG
jgi:anthranilate phosphoribosyltransferase